MLPVIKYRRLTCKVGAFGEITIESLTDLDISMIFPVGSMFVFDSWIYHGKLQGHLVEIPKNQDFSAISADMPEHLTEKFDNLSISDSTADLENIEAVRLRV